MSLLTEPVFYLSICQFDLETTFGQFRNGLWNLIRTVLAVLATSEAISTPESPAPRTESEA